MMKYLASDSMFLKSYYILTLKYSLPRQKTKQSFSVIIKFGMSLQSQVDNRSFFNSNPQIDSWHFHQYCEYLRAILPHCLQLPTVVLWKGIYSQAVIKWWAFFFPSTITTAVPSFHTPTSISLSAGQDRHSSSNSYWSKGSAHHGHKSRPAPTHRHRYSTARFTICCLLCLYYVTGVCCLI